MKYQDKLAEVQMFDRIARNDIWQDDTEMNSFLCSNVWKLGIDPHSVLELGCGVLCIGEQFFRNAEYIGVDISRASISSAKDMGYNAIWADAEDWSSFKRNRFDVIICIAFLHHFPNVSLVMDNINRWLKPGGHLIVYEPDARNYFIMLSNSCRRLLEIFTGSQWMVNRCLATPNETIHTIDKYTECYTIVLDNGFRQTTQPVNFLGHVHRLYQRIFKNSYWARLIVLRKDT